MHPKLLIDKHHGWVFLAAVSRSGDISVLWPVARVGCLRMMA